MKALDKLADMWFGLLMIGFALWILLSKGDIIQGALALVVGFSEINHQKVMHELKEIRREVQK